MAPEQAVGDAVGPYTDLYAAGLIAYEMLTRRLPFQGASPVALIIQHVQKEPPAPSSFVDVHPALDALVLRMLAKDPSQRPVSAEEVRRELRLILQQLSQGEQVSPAAVRATPSAPVSTLRASAPVPVSSARPQAEGASLQGDEGAAAAELEKSSRSNRRGLIGGAAALAVVLAALSGWMMRGIASTDGAPPAVPASPVPAAVQAPASPAPGAPGPAESQEPRDAAATSPGPQPGDGVENTSSSSPKTGPKMGTLQLSISGSGTIRVDGKVMGTVPPLNKLELHEGKHRLEVLNPNARPYSTRITIVAGRVLKHRVELQPKETGETP